MAEKWKASLTDIGNKHDIKSYRPITLTSAVYRMAMQMLKVEWKPGKRGGGKVLGELPTEFRKGRIEGNLFVVTWCIEIAEKHDQPL